MFLLKIGGYLMAGAGLILAVLAFAVPQARFGLALAAVACLIGGVINILIFRALSPMMKKLPMPKGAEQEDPTSLRGSIRMAGAMTRQSVGMLQDATATLQDVNRASRLRDTGKWVKAEVLAMRDTSQLLNLDPVLEFDLRVHPHDGDLYHVAGHRQLVSKLVYPKIQVGGVYNAKVDPDDPNSLIVSWS